MVGACGSGSAFVVACVTGLIVHGQHRKYGNALLTRRRRRPSAAGGQAARRPADGRTPTGRARQSLMRAAGNISATALHDFVDITVS